MKSLLNCLFFTLFLIVLGCKSPDPCLDKDTFVRSYDAFIDSVDQKQQLSIEEWQDLDRRFNNFMDNCFNKFEPEMSTQEKLDIGQKALTYYYQRVRQAIQNEEVLKDIDLHVEGDLLEAFEEIEDDVLKFYNENLKDDLKDIFDEVSEDVKDLHTLLKEKLEKYEKEN